MISGAYSQISIESVCWVPLIWCRPNAITLWAQTNKSAMESPTTAWSEGVVLQEWHFQQELLRCKKHFFLQHTVFVAYIFFLFIYLFIYSNIAMNCLLCLCMVSCTLNMHIGSLWGLKCCIWHFNLERSWSWSKVKVTGACDPSNRSHRRLEYDGDKTFHFRANLD